MRIKAEIMVKHFDPELLIKKSNILVTGNDEYVPAAMQLLSSEQDFEWRIQVNADTMAQADYSMEKQDRIDFMTAVSGFMQQVGPMLEAAPESAPVMLGLLKWTVAGFRGARDIEGMLDKALDALSKQPEKPEGPSPEELKAKAEADKLQQEAQMEQQRFQMEQQAAQQQAMLDQQKAQMEMQAEQQRLAMEQQRMQMDMMFEQLMGELKLKNAQEMADVKLETAEAQAELKAQADRRASAESKKPE